jgi:hypothetical protein
MDPWEIVAQARAAVEWTEKVIEQQRAMLDDFVGPEREKRYWSIRSQERRLKLMRRYLRESEQHLSALVYGWDLENLRELS